jgi:hypothetical protein
MGGVRSTHWRDMKCPRNSGSWPLERPRSTRDDNETDLVFFKSTLNYSLFFGRLCWSNKTIYVRLSWCIISWSTERISIKFDIREAYTRICQVKLNSFIRDQYKLCIIWSSNRTFYQFSQIRINIQNFSTRYEVQKSLESTTFIWFIFRYGEHLTKYN